MLINLVLMKILNIFNFLKSNMNTWIISFYFFLHLISPCFRFKKLK